MSTTHRTYETTPLGSLPSSDAIESRTPGLTANAPAIDANLICSGVEQLPGPIYAKDKDRRYVFANEACLRLFGRPRSEVIGATDQELFEEAEDYGTSDDMLLSTGCAHTYETSVPLPNGRQRHILVSKRLTAGRDLIVGQMTDITSRNKREIALNAARKLAEDAGREARNTLDLLHEATVGSVQGIIVLGRQNIEFCNARARELNGVPESILGVGKPWIEFFDYQMERGDFGEGREAQEFYDALLENFEKREVMQIESNAGDGIVIRADRVPNALGGLTLTLTDITEIKKRERELEEARNLALSAERAKSEFLANMSHEIRTPMNGVMGMAELLMGGELSAKQKMFAEMILKSGASLLTIINDILDFSKIDAGQLELVPAPFNLAEAIEDVAALMSTKAAEKDLELIVRVDPDLPSTFLGDVGRIRQIITNLVGNAVKFTQTGHVFVNVSGTLLEDRRSCVQFRIEDTGEGIPDHKCQSIFDKFQQADNSATRQHEGTGLGLSIASSLVELMGGEIGVESREGAGSTFWFTVNLPVEGQAKPKARVPGDVTGARVLIIDDNGVNRSILSEQMEAWRFEHAQLESGELGLALLRQAAHQGLKIDLLILDYQMPKMGGAEVLREIRSDPLISATPVILLTSVDTADMRSVLGALEPQATLIKPARSSALLTRSSTSSPRHEARQRKSTRPRSRHWRSRSPFAVLASLAGNGKRKARTAQLGWPPRLIRRPATGSISWWPKTMK